MSASWLRPSRQQFYRLSQRLPHALLIHGQAGSGKSEWVMEIVASLLCESPTVVDEILSACGRCKNCAMFESDNHPDFHFLSSEWFTHESESAHLMYAERYFEPLAKRGKRKPRRVISVDQVRTLNDDFALSRHSARYKVALIQPAEAMNTSAANALLKLLEEPNPQSVIILVSHDMSRLPMTIRSRCIALKLSLPTLNQGLLWLQDKGLEESVAKRALAISGGAPRLALLAANSEDLGHFDLLLEALVNLLQRKIAPVAARESLVKLQTADTLLKWLQWVMGWWISAEKGVESGDEHAYHISIEKLRRVGPKEAQLFKLYDDLLEARKQDLNILNSALVLDKWLIALSRGKN